MTIKELVEVVDPDSIEIVELEEENIYKAKWNVPYVPTPEFEILLERMADMVKGTSKEKDFRKFLNTELEAIENERTMYPFDFSVHFDDRESKIKNILSLIF